MQDTRKQATEGRRQSLLSWFSWGKPTSGRPAHMYFQRAQSSVTSLAAYLGAH